MLILVLFVAWTLYSISSDAWYTGLRSCRNLRFWVQLLTAGLVLYVVAIVD